MNKKEILSVFELLSEEHLNEIYKIAELFSSSMVSKSDILRYCDIDRNNKIDTALPAHYVKSIQDILPRFSTMFNVYDYRTNRFGEMTNIAELFIKTAHDKLSNY